MVFTSKIINTSSEQQQEQILTHIDYLQSNGNQYLNTGVTGNQNTHIRLEVSISNHNGCGLFGSRKSPNVDSLNIFNYNDQIRIDYNTVSTYLSRDTDQKIIIDIDKGLLFVDNVTEDQMGQIQGGEVFTTSVNLYLFTVNTNGVPFYPGVTMKLYRCYIWNDNVLVRNFIPVKDLNNIECLYDTVSKSYFYTQTIS